MCRGCTWPAHKPLGGDGLIEDARRADDDIAQLVGAVKLQLEQHTEAVAQRAGDLARTGGRTHQREPGQIDADALGAGAFADHNIQRIVFQCRVKHLFHLPGEAVYLVDEVDVALLQIGQQGGEVAGLSMAGPLVMRICTPISLAMMPASVVLPRPGGP